MKEINELLINLCFSLDQINGEGTVVDSYSGNYTPKIFDNKAAVINEFNEIQDLLNNQEASLEVIEIKDIVRSLKAFFDLGEKNSYKKTIEDIYFLPLPDLKKEVFLKQKAAIERLLKENGYNEEWPGSIKQWIKNNTVSPEEYLEELKKKTEIFKTLSFEKIASKIDGIDVGHISNHSEIKFEIVEGKGNWSAYNLYKGNYTSKIEVNKNAELIKPMALIFASHEVFPGHHFDLSIKENLCKNNVVGLYSTVNLLNSSGSILSEGIADNGLDFIGYKPTPNEQIAIMYDRLKMDFRHFLAIQVIDGDMSKEAAINELQTLCGEEAAESIRSINFALEWKYYFPCYVMGYYFVKELFEQFGAEIFQSLYKSSSPQGLKSILTTIES